MAIVVDMNNVVVDTVAMHVVDTNEIISIDSMNVETVLMVFYYIMMLMA